jgi:hypothetical protein
LVRSPKPITISLTIESEFRTDFDLLDEFCIPEADKYISEQKIKNVNKIFFIFFTCL